MQGEKDCWVCDPGGTGLSPGSRSDRFRCKDWFGSQGRPRTAKMAVAMACSDREVRWCRGISRHGYLNCTEANLPRTGDYKGLRWCTEQPWIERGATRLVHLPVARHDDDRTAALGFDSVVDDHQYLKPVRLPEAIRPWDPEAGPMVCEPGAAREQVLLYVGRLRCGTKGQQAFVESVDPGLLAGLAIEVAHTAELALPSKHKPARLQRARPISRWSSHRPLCPLPSSSSARTANPRSSSSRSRGS